MLIAGFEPINSVEQFDSIETDTSTFDTPGMIWNHTYYYEGAGRKIVDHFYSFKRVSDGFILLGGTFSFGSGEIEDTWLVKTNEEGVKQWENKISIGEDDTSTSIMVKQGGFYVIVGNCENIYTEAYEGAYMFSSTSTNGGLLWTKFYGETNHINDASKHLFSDIYKVTGRQDNSIWQMKTNYEGVPLWEKTYTYAGMKGEGDIVCWTSDGGSIIVGTLRLNTVGSKNSIILIKTDTNGNLEWNRFYGGDENDYPVAAQQTSDGGYVIAGNTESYASGDYGYDWWLIKTDENGNVQWEKTYGDASQDKCYDMKQTSDNGYILLGKNGTMYSLDHTILIKTDNLGNIENIKSFPFGGIPNCIEEGVEENQFLVAGSIDQTGWFFKCYMDSTGPECHIIHPFEGFYLNGNKILSLTRLTVTIGDVNIEVDNSDIDSGVEKIEIMINDEIKHTTLDPSSPYEWLWHETTPGIYTIKVIAYDNAGYITEDKVMVLDIF